MAISPSTSWEVAWDEELAEIQKALAAKAAAELAGEEPKEWPITVSEEDKSPQWPTNAWVHPKGIRIET